MHISQLLTAYDQQVRGSFPSRIPPTWTATIDGPITRCLTEHGGFVLAQSGLWDRSTAELEALVAETVEGYRKLRTAFEWKTFSHDNPEIVAALLNHGFVPDEPEALILGAVGALTGPDPSLPDIVIRQAQSDDLRAIAVMEEEIWSEPWDWFVPEMTSRLSEPDPPYVVVAETTERQIVCAGWLVPMPGTEFSGLWGGSTRPEFRSRGIYRAVVRARANEAARRGFTLLQVDATEHSRPILEHLGLTVVGTTTPYRWSPAPEVGGDGPAATG